jgi:hypothetical protein
MLTTSGQQAQGRFRAIAWRILKGNCGESSVHHKWVTMKFNLPALASRVSKPLHRPVGRAGLVVVTLFVATAPAVLFFDPADYWPGRGHVARTPSTIYILYSDDIAYASASRTFSSTVSKLLVPHNAHVVPAWRLVTWGLVASAGKLSRLPEVLAVASYSILVAVMLLTGRLVARETGRAPLGFLAMAIMGTTSLMLVPATWYSAGQPLWAGFGVLAVLWFAQSYRRRARWQAPALAALTIPLAGWMWAAGHVAGPVAAVYLWVDGRKRCRIAAAVLLAVTALTVAFTLTIGGRMINNTISFHGRSPRQAATPTQGLLHTGQAITENLAFGNLGLTVHTTQTQGALLTCCVLLFWSSRCWMNWFQPAKAVKHPPLRPLECAGVALVLSSYLIEWTFRGYMEYQFLRTINLWFIVPWYDAIPQIGLVLMIAGWWDAAQTHPAASPGRRVPARLTWGGAAALAILVLVMIILNRPRVDHLVRESVPPLLPSEQKEFPIPRLQTMRASILLLEQAARQRAFLRRLDLCDQHARSLGLSRHTIRAAFGHRWLPGTSAPVLPSMYDEYDAAALLDLPDDGRSVDPASVRARLGEYFVEDREQRPGWLEPNDPWPPPRRKQAQE